MKIKILILILMTFFVKCSIDEHNGNKIEKDFYDDGSIKAEYTVNKYGKKHGIETTFFKNGNIQGIYQYKNDTINGLCKEYYENGNLRYKYYLRRNVIIGSAYEYYQNGRLSKYKLFDTLGRLAYFREYKKNGEFKKEEGVGSITDIIRKVEYKDSTVFTIKLTIIDPPNTTKHIKFIQYGKENTKTRLSEIKDTTQLSYYLNTQYGNKLNIILEIDDGEAISEFSQTLNLN